MLSKMRSTHQNLLDIEHHEIIDAIGCKFMYYNPESKTWEHFQNFSIDYTYESILIKCKYSRYSIKVPYPFKLTPEFLYLWGLIASRCSAKSIQGINTRMEVQVSVEKEELIKEITQKLGFQIKITEYKHARHKWNTSKRPTRPKKIQVTFPLVFKKFLLALGYNPKKTRLPNWLTSEQKMNWLEGYLSSQKVQMEYWGYGRVYRKQLMPRIKIKFHTLDLMENATKIFSQLGIKFTRSCSKTIKNFYISIYEKQSIIKLAKEFSITLPINHAFISLVKQIDKDPQLSECLSKLELNSFQYVLYGLILAQPDQEIEYTVLEKVLACSSNDIRSGLYYLREMGFINYYTKEKNREYITRSDRYLEIYNKRLNAESKVLERYENMILNNEILFRCQDCGHIFGYIEGIVDRSFRCPKCNSSDIYSEDSKHDLRIKNVQELKLCAQLSEEYVI